MTTTANAENLRQYKSIFSSIVEHILSFTFGANLIKKDKNLLPNFKQLHDDVLRYS